MENRSVPVRVEGLVKAYGAVNAVGGIDFDVAPSSTVTLLGPSGCGKTTTLRCIAGLEVPTAGRITVGDTVVFDGATGTFVEPERRNIGMVFQSYAIWPHMTVGGNVGFPLRISGVNRKETSERVRHILGLVGLAEYEDRSASALSGGQQQRVALARALVHEPSVVLFDEPLSNLDANLRERMRTELQILQSRLGFTAIFVTHDQEEALALSDRIIIINKGLIEQEGSPREVFQHPATAFTAKFLGYSNVLPGSIVAVQDAAAQAGRSDTHTVTIDLGTGEPLAARWRSPETPKPGLAAMLAFRADRVAVSARGAGNAAGADGANRLPGEVEAAAFLGTYIDYTLKAGALQVKAEGAVDTASARGDAVTLTIPRDQCHAFPAVAEG